MRETRVSRLRLEDYTCDDEWFWSRVDRRGPTDCWPWQRAKSSNGYGVVHIPVNWSPIPVTTSAHRVSWVMAHRELIPPDMTVDHRCYTPDCVNPAHLELVTHRLNVRRQRRSLRPYPRFLKDGTSRWVVRWYLEGSTRAARRTKARTFLTEQEAQEFAGSLRAERSEPTPGVPVPQPQGTP